MKTFAVQFARLAGWYASAVLLAMAAVVIVAALLTVVWIDLLRTIAWVLAPTLCVYVLVILALRALDSINRSRALAQYLRLQAALTTLAAEAKFMSGTESEQDLRNEGYSHELVILARTLRAVGFLDSIAENKFLELRMSTAESRSAFLKMKSYMHGTPDEMLIEHFILSMFKNDLLERGWIDLQTDSEELTAEAIEGIAKRIAARRENESNDDS